jgi:ABC-type sugar transport system permease subunit
MASPAAGFGASRLAFLRSQRAGAVFLLLPALVYLAVMTQAPFVLTLWYSFHNWILTSPQLGHRWVGLANFRYAVTQDPIFRAAVVNTLEITAAVVGGSLVLGLGFALLLNRSFPLRGVARSLMIAPFFVMPTVNAVVQKNLFLNPIFGLVNWLWTSDIPVILLTARASEADIEEGLAAGADDYIAKPFSPQELAARIQVILAA